MITFDNILENKIQNGPFQYHTVFCLSFTQFIEGIEIAFLSILLSILKNEWNLQNWQTSWYASTYLFGVGIGILFCGFFGDFLGRRNIYTYSLLINGILSLIASRLNNFYHMLIIRFLQSFQVGIGFNLGFILLSELCTKKYRGRYLAVCHLFLEIGKIFFVFLCFIFLNDFENGNWRGFYLCLSLICLFGFISCYFYLWESPRLYLLEHQFSKAFKNINLFCYINHQNHSQDLTTEEKDSLIKNQMQTKSLSNLEKLNRLLSSQYRQISILLWFLMISFYIQNFSLILLLPFILADQNKGFIDLLYTYIGESIAVLMTIFFIDQIKTGGRKGIFFFSVIVAIILQSLIFILKENLLVLNITLLKMSFRLFWPAFAALSSEVYQTDVRILGVCLSFSQGQFFAMISTTLILFTYQIDKFVPFLILAVTGMLQFLITLLLPHDKAQIELEKEL